MNEKNFQHTLDSLIDKLFLWAIPPSVKPNWLTYFRIITTPIVFWLLVSNQMLWGLVLFVVSASTDFLDGAMARTRDQITDLGKVIDPVADKMLIGVMLIFFGYQYLVVKIFLVFIFLEIVAVVLSAALSYKIGRPIGANVFGKIKMILQSICVFLFFIAAIFHIDYLMRLSEYALYLALFFAILAAIEVSRRKMPQLVKVIKKMP